MMDIALALIYIVVSSAVAMVAVRVLQLRR